MKREQIVILLAEDDDGHAHLIQRNLRRAGLVNPIVRVEDGQLALDYIYRRGQHANRSADTPLLVLLDINMPRLDGVEVLRLVKADPGQCRIPVIILTTTDDPREIERCYQLGCSVYIAKPVKYDEFAEALTRLGMFLEIVKLPTINNQA